MNEFLGQPVGILTKTRADALYQPLNAATTLLGNTVTGSGAIVRAGSPVIVTPTIASFVNAAHTHQDAAGGGTLDHGLALTGLSDDDHPQYIFLTPTTSARNVIKSSGDFIPLTVRRQASGSAQALLVLGDETSGVLSQFNSDGSLSIGGTTATNNITVSGTAKGTIYVAVNSSSVASNNTLFQGTIGNAVTGSVNGFIITGDVTANLKATVANTNNSNAAAHAYLELSVGGASAGDPKMTFTVTGNTTWAMGVDNSISDRFAVAAGTIGTNDVLTITTGGNVGIGLGTTSAAQKLHMLDGHIRMDQVATPSAPSVAVGAAGVLTGAYLYSVSFVTATGETSRGTVSASVSPSSQQVALTNIPVSTDTSVTSRKIYRTLAGGQNTAMFLVATIADNTTTTFNDNVADGSLTTFMPFKNTTGGNIFIGTSRVMMVDPSFVGLGLNAGNATAVGGVNCVAIGTSALSSITSGTNDVAVGFNTLAAATTASTSTVVGTSAAVSLTTGSQNTAMGYTAMQFNQTGTDNAIFGYTAGAGVSGNSYTQNTIFGSRAGNALTTGGSNVLVGYSAGNTLTTGANNIIVGYNIQAPAVSSSNFMSIGNLIFSAGVDGTGTTLSSGNIGVGIAAPVTKFHTVLTNTDTNIVANVATFGHNSTSTPANNFGTGLLLQGQTDTTANANMFRARTQWTTATHASRKTRTIISAYDTAERDAIGIGADGSAALLGFYPTVAAAPIAQPTTAIASATFVANTSGITNDTATYDGYTHGQVVKALRNLGILA